MFKVVNKVNKNTRNNSRLHVRFVIYLNIMNFDRIELEYRYTYLSKILIEVLCLVSLCFLAYACEQVCTQSKSDVFISFEIDKHEAMRYPPCLFLSSPAKISNMVFVIVPIFKLDSNPKENPK